MTRNELDNHFRMIRQLHDAQEIQQSIFSRAEREKGDAERQAILSECLDDIGQRIARYERLLAELSPDVVAFINSVRASRVRQVLRLRFLHGLAWCEIPCFVVFISESEFPSALIGPACRGIGVFVVCRVNQAAHAKICISVIAIGIQPCH